jgi:hypothetical protein
MMTQIWGSVPRRILVAYQIAISNIRGLGITSFRPVHFTIDDMHITERNEMERYRIAGRGGAA